MRHILGVALGLGIAFGGASSWAMTLDEAREAHKRGEYEAAVAVFQTLAEEGNPGALNALAVAYWNGQGVEYDLARALELLEQAAAQDLGRATYNLGIFWRNGEGEFERDLAKAADYFDLAIQQGYIGAYSARAELYRDYTTPPDYASAAPIYEAGVAAGDVLSASALGFAYEEGQGVEVDYDRAAELYALGLERGTNDGAAGLAFLHARGRGFEQSFDAAMEYVRQFRDMAADNGNPTSFADIAEDIVGDQKSEHDGAFAVHILETGVAEGDATSMYALAEYYRDGTFVDEDVDRARALFRQAANAGMEEAIYQEGLTYSEFDPEEAVQALALFQEGADKGVREAVTGLAYHYYFGYGVEQDLVKAHDYAQQAVTMPEPDFYDYYNLASDYLHGTGTEPDSAKAFEHFQNAYDTYSVGAESWLGDFYKQGLEVDADLARAIAFYSEGVQWGDERSAWSLGQAYEFGEGVEQNYSTAYVLYRTAFEAEYWEAGKALARAASDWPEGDWTDAEDAYRYCLKSVEWEREPYIEWSLDDCAGYKAVLSTYRASIVEAEVAADAGE